MQREAPCPRRLHVQDEDARAGCKGAATAVNAWLENLVPEPMQSRACSCLPRPLQPAAPRQQRLAAQPQARTPPTQARLLRDTKHASQQAPPWPSLKAGLGRRQPLRPSRVLAPVLLRQCHEQKHHL